MDKKVIIIHGWEGSPDSNWFPWLKEKLSSQGDEVFVPAMPNSDFPVMSEWIEKIKEVVGEPTEKVCLVGHSLGAIAILRYLESLSLDQKIGTVVLVAGFSESIGIKEIENFFGLPVDYERVAKSAARFVAVHSDNDPYVPMIQGEILRDKLGAELIVLENARHLNGKDGFTELPIVLEKLSN